MNHLDEDKSGENEAEESRTLAECIDDIEEAYEALLAYAAEGATDETAAAGRGPREYLEQLAEALEAVGPATLVEARWLAVDTGQACGAFVEVLELDAAKALKAVRLVLSVPLINSQLVENLNATIHLRSLLTDLFLIDEALKACPSYEVAE